MIMQWNDYHEARRLWKMEGQMAAGDGLSTLAYRLPLGLAFAREPVQHVDICLLKRENPLSTRALKS